MPVLTKLKDKIIPKKYNPDDDNRIRERDDIGRRTDRVVTVTAEIMSRVESSRFPILLDDPKR